MQTELRMSDGKKVTLRSISLKNKGVIYINWDGIDTHVLTSDLDSESQRKIEEIIAGRPQE